ncbi:MAG TPA: hypothetical protein PKJ16_04160 [Spirochaetota bacterium]|nr:hypothetical protein [Spirochaetota bacterium]
MHSQVVKRIIIKKGINLVPENRLDEVKTYIDTIINQSDGTKPRPVSLQGIWKGTGFEKLPSLEDEIRDLRRDLSSVILKKHA